MTELVLVVAILTLLVGVAVGTANRHYAASLRFRGQGAVPDGQRQRPYAPRSPLL